MEWYYERDRNGTRIQVLGFEKSELKKLSKVFKKIGEKEYARLEKKREKLQGMHEAYGISEKQIDEMIEAEDDMRTLGSFLSTID